MDARVQKVVTRMRGEFRQEPSLSEMAQIVNLSQSRLRYLFKREIGIAPGHYLRAFRLEQAKELLETTFLSVKEIISSIGVNDQSHFIRVFKKTYGLTPAQYRMSLATNNNDAETCRNLEGLLVLLVEDDRDTRELIGIMLERAGASVTTIASSGKALAALERMRPHILIIDIGLPDEDGYALIRKARALLDQRGEKIPAVALTAYSSEEDREQALSAGFEIHMPKPPGPRQLIEVIARLTGRIEVSDREFTAIGRTAKTANKQYKGPACIENGCKYCFPTMKPPPNKRSPPTGSSVSLRDSLFTCQTQRMGIVVRTVLKKMRRERRRSLLPRLKLFQTIYSNTSIWLRRSAMSDRSPFVLSRFAIAQSREPRRPPLGSAFMSSTILSR